MNEAQIRALAAEVLAGIAPEADLATVGDDEDLRALDRLRRNPAYPPNVAYWFERTREELEQQWKKTTAEWPEPWRHWEAPESDKYDEQILE